MHWTKFLHIALVTLALAAYGNWVSRSRSREALPLTGPGIPATDIPRLNLDQVKALWHQDSTLFVDVRSEADYSFGHIRGAICLPDKARIEAELPRLRSAKAIVVYCKSPDCGKSFWAALDMRQAGLTQTMIYPNGWYEWSDAGLPSERTAEP